MAQNNIACRIFKEQIDLIQQLPENERPVVLYGAILNAFNQFDNQNDNQNECAYVSVSVSVSISVLGKCILDLLSKNIAFKEFSSNYGGKRTGAGKKNAIKESDATGCNGMPRDATALPRDAVGMPPKISKDKISKDNKGGMGGKEEPDNVSNVIKVSSPLKEKFVAPNIEEVMEYAKFRNCTDETAQKFFDYYSTQGWKDSKGNKVKNWKGKFIAIWDKPENKIQPEEKFWL